MTFHRPDSLDEAIRIAGQDPGARYLSGGQALVAELNETLDRPTALISLRGVAELSGISRQSGVVRIGAMTTHAELAAEAGLGALGAAAAAIGQPAIRNRGTIGGAIAAADPMCDLNAPLLAMDAKLICAGPAGAHAIPFADYWAVTPAERLLPGELIAAIELPDAQVDPDGVYLRHGLTAVAPPLVGVTAVAGAPERGDGDVLVACTGGERPFLGGPVGAALEDQAIAEAATKLAEDCRPTGTPVASAAYQARLITGLCVRALRRLREEWTRRDG